MNVFTAGAKIPSSTTAVASACPPPSGREDRTVTTPAAASHAAARPGAHQRARQLELAVVHHPVRRADLPERARDRHLAQGLDGNRFGEDGVVGGGEELLGARPDL